MVWWGEYYVRLYMILEFDDMILERFLDVFVNCFELLVDGKIMFILMMNDDVCLVRFFIEIIEEINWCGILYRGLMQLVF